MNYKIPANYNTLNVFFSVFFAFDEDKDNCINVKEWVKGLSVFLRGTFEEKLKCKVTICNYWLSNMYCQFCL